jgi:hypothetical protein
LRVIIASRKVPRRDAAHDADRLLDDDDALVGLMPGWCRRRRAWLLRRTTRERRAVGDLAARLGERLCPDSYSSSAAARGSPPDVCASKISYVRGSGATRWPAVLRGRSCAARHHRQRVRRGIRSLADRPGA